MSSFMSSGSSNSDGKPPLWCLIGACSPSILSSYASLSWFVVGVINIIFDFEDGCSLSDFLSNSSKWISSDCTEASSNAKSSSPWSSISPNLSDVAELYLFGVGWLYSNSSVRFSYSASSWDGSSKKKDIWPLSWTTGAIRAWSSESFSESHPLMRSKLRQSIFKKPVDVSILGWVVI